jgi:hypothetical protein
MTDDRELGGTGAFVIDPAPLKGLGATCREILDTVPTGFGIPEANDTSRRHLTVVLRIAHAHHLAHRAVGW